MPRSLSIDDFKPYSITCELRYKNAYLIFDRTGQIIEDMRRFIPEINISSASPQQTGFTSNEETFNLEVGACRLTRGQIDKGGENFAKHCKAFFDIVTDRLQIEVFTRIGLRYIAKMEFKSESEAKVAITGLQLSNLNPAKRFNISEMSEILLRWEDSEIGAMFRLKAETTTINLTTAPELKQFLPIVEKKIIGLTLDIDYYTVAPVEREQLNFEEWLVQKIRVIKKEAEGILQGGAR
jgi:hypothetical protein